MAALVAMTIGPERRGQQHERDRDHGEDQPDQPRGDPVSEVQLAGRRTGDVGRHLLLRQHVVAQRVHQVAGRRSLRARGRDRAEDRGRAGRVDRDRADRRDALGARHRLLHVGQQRVVGRGRLLGQHDHDRERAVRPDAEALRHQVERAPVRVAGRIGAVVGLAQRDREERDREYEQHPDAERGPRPRTCADPAAPPGETPTARAAPGWPPRSAAPVPWRSRPPCARSTGRSAPGCSPWPRPGTRAPGSARRAS